MMNTQTELSEQIFHKMVQKKKKKNITSKVPFDKLH